MPILFMALLSNIKNFLIAQNGLGVGSPLPVQRLAYSLPDYEKLVFVQPPSLGPDVETVVKKIADPLGAKKRLVFLTQPEELLTTCRESLQGVSDCCAAVVFNDSPLTVGKHGMWNYTIRTNSALSGGSFFASQHNNDAERVNLPLQVAIDNAITNSTIVPNEYLYTSISQATQDSDVRKTYQSLIISTYGIAFFVGLVSSAYHMVGMMTTERESGMTQLIDAMGGTAAARICSHILAFNIIYLPSWIIIGTLFWVEVFRTTSVAILIFWQVFTGMAITSASTFTAMFFNRAQLSGIYTILGFLVVGVIGQIVDHGSADTGTVAALSLLFPSMNYMFMIGYVARYELQNLPTNMVRAVNATSDQSSTSKVSGILLWVFLWLQIIVYPILAAYTERYIPGVRSEGRTFGPEPGESLPAAIELSGVTKAFPATLRQKWLTRGHVGDVVAVDNLDLAAQKGQILCLLGANGSGKTTVLDMIGGLQGLTKGSIHINAKPSQLGICPQRNVLWDELTIAEHVSIFNQIKHSQEGETALDSLIEACDLSAKRTARSDTLSGGQKRKLQLACMFVGGSSVCLLDEVSSGLDPLSRRVIWNIILAERSRRTMVLTTHFLDEADVLADHISIISLGRLECKGSAVELKSRFGGGYRVHIPGRIIDSDLGFPIKRLWDHTVCKVPDSTHAAAVLSTLEAKGYMDVFVNGPTIEDVFLRVAEGTYLAQNESVGDEDGNLTPTRSRAVSEVSMKLSSGQEISFIRQIQVLSRKRFIILIRNWLPYLFAFLIPVVTTPALQILDFSGLSRLAFTAGDQFSHFMARDPYQVSRSRIVLRVKAPQPMAPVRNRMPCAKVKERMAADAVAQAQLFTEDASAAVVAQTKPLIDLITSLLKAMEEQQQAHSRQIEEQKQAAQSRNDGNDPDSSIKCSGAC